MSKTKKKGTKQSSWLRRQLRFLKHMRVGILEGTLFLAFVAVFFSVLVLHAAAGISNSSYMAGRPTYLAQIYRIEFANRLERKLAIKAEEIAIANSQALAEIELGVVGEMKLLEDEKIENTDVKTISFVTPVDGSVVSGGQQVSIVADKNANVVKIEAFFDDRLITSSNGNSLKFLWNTRKANAGLHQWKAIATDSEGNVTESVINVTNQ